MRSQEPIEIGQLVRARRCEGRVVEIDEAAGTVTLRTSHGDNWPVPRSEILRPLVSRERALDLLDRLASPGSHDAPLPAAPEGRALFVRLAQVFALPEGERDEARWALQPELEAWFQARSPEALIDDVRNALAARLVATTAPERSHAIMFLYNESRSLFAELAMVLGRSPIDIEYAVARGHRAAAPRELVAHAYLGHFTTKGPLLVSDFCYMSGGRNKLMQAALEGKRGRYHAWVSWSSEAPGSERELLVVHDDALDLIGIPTRKVGTVYNDAGMVGVYDVEATKSASFEGWVRAQAENGAALVGILDGRGALARSDGDGGWDVRAAYVDHLAVLIRVVLHRDVEGTEPIIVASSVAATTPARTYSPRESFAAGESLAHPKFGTGRVLSATKDTMEVAFPDAVRKLVHGRA